MMPRAFPAALALAAALLAATTGAAAPSDRYTVTTDTVVDTKSGLTWQRAAAPATYTWLTALDYCANLRVGGAGGFHLPTLKELQTVVDETAAAAPFIDATAFPGTPASAFWSSTPSVDQPNKAWGIQFTTGGTATGVTTATWRVRCVK